MHALPVPRSVQERPAQQGALALQAWSDVPQVAGGTQTPPSHVSVAPQQGTVAEQLWLVCAQAAAPWQVPLVVPAGMAQERPAQQSPFTVHRAPDAEQVGLTLVASAHVPSTQVPLQQSAAAVAVVQLPPVSLQVEDEVARRHA